MDEALHPAAEEPAEVAPYGLLGLILGSLVIGLIAAVFCALVCGLAFGVAVAILGFDGTVTAFASLRPAGGADTAFLVQIGIVASMLVYAAIVAAIVVVAWFRGRARWRDIIALRPWHPFRRTKLFWAAAVAGFFYNLGVSALIAWFYPASKDWITTPKGTGWIAAFVVLAVVFAPIAEETVFRGWLFTGLKRAFGATATIAATSVLFALAHWESTHLYALAVLPVGIVLGLIREKTGTIAASITFHAFYNGAASLLLVFGS